MITKYAVAIAIAAVAAFMAMNAIVEDPEYFSTSRWASLIPLLSTTNYLVDRVQTGEGNVYVANVTRDTDKSLKLFVDLCATLVLIATLLFLA